MIRPLYIACSILAAWPGVANAQSPAPPAPPPIPPAAQPEAAWPPVMKLVPIQSPNWSDPDLYPSAARALDQQGTVAVEVWVGRDGVPKACRTFRSSGFAALDEGTCALLLKVRYAPPVNLQGQPVEATQRSMIVWRLSPAPTRFAASGITVRLRFGPAGPNLPPKLEKCELNGVGPLFPQWATRGCDIFAGATPYYLGAHQFTARRATLFVAMTPSSVEPVWNDSGLGRLVASRRIHFEIDRQGKTRNCRTSVDHGLGKFGVDRSYPCGIFLFQHSFEKIGRNQPARAGVIDIRVFVDEAP